MMAQRGLLDGAHLPYNIAFYAFGIGVLFGSGLILAFKDDSLSWIGVQFMTLAVFHLLEYLVTALFNPSKLELGSFLIPHSKSYLAANAVSISEYVLVQYYWPGMHTSWPLLLRTTGVVLIALGQFSRSYAMISAKSNFSHTVEYYKRDDHQLVTSGIYAYLRHPSYFGYFWWGIGTQLAMGNCVSTIVYAIVLWKFFKDRIVYEEQLLVRFFGKQYRNYAAATSIGIPFIS